MSCDSAVLLLQRRSLFLFLLLLLLGTAASFVSLPGGASCARARVVVRAEEKDASPQNPNATVVAQGSNQEKKKKKKDSVDRRDALPFAVQLQPTPSDTTLRSTVYSYNSEKEEEAVPQVLLGEFALDASTTSGDTIGIGTQLYRVVRHRSLYQYQQGRFQMVRKILEVREWQRYRTEEALQRQYARSAPAPPLEEL
jgi:hypothetical protein